MLGALRHSKDVAYNNKLAEKYEDHFFDPIPLFELYVTGKYIEMCILKLNGNMLKNHPELYDNMDSEQVKTIFEVKAEELIREERKAAHK